MYSFNEFVNFHFRQPIEDLAKLGGFSVRVFDKNSEIIFRTENSSVCKSFHSKQPEVLARDGNGHDADE